MDFHSFVLLFSLSAGFSWANGEPCFTFHGNGFLRFDILNFDNSGSAHFSMKFKTTSPHGLLMYSEGKNGDEEAIFIRDRMLIYHIFNSCASGVESCFGGTFMGTVDVTSGEEIEIHAYRAFNVTDSVQRRVRPQTGLVYTVNSRTYTHVDHRPRSGISLQDGVYVGGYKQSLSDTVGNFTGQIYGIREEKNGAVFRTFSRNEEGRVTASCVTFQPV